MTAIEFRTALERLGIPQRWLAERLGVDKGTVNRWALGERPVPPYVPYVLALLEQLPHERGTDRRRKAA
jgi:DNA-binding transcriptional regulator YdaS (Cro superfamily)